MITDPIANYLTQIRNALLAKHSTVDVPHSGTKVAISKVLKEKGYIQDYKVVDEPGAHKKVRIALKYDNVTKVPAIVKLQRVSKPGLRKYTTVAAQAPVLNGLGIMILSTSKGIISDKEAKKLNVGGEQLCFVH